MSRHFRQMTSVAGVAVALAGVAAMPAAAEMRSEQIGKHLCKTTGGGRFVDIPGFPGERIDRRLLPDIRWMKRRYDIFITDGYSTSSVHSPNGEHPIGLALDIVPYFSKGGTWGKIGDLAHRFEPRQDEVRMPFRWIGWNGDSGHGRGHHLHLSYAHSPTPPREPARIVYTRECPEKTGDADGSGGGGTGGISPAKSSRSSLTPRELAGLAPVVPERG